MEKSDDLEDRPEGDKPKAEHDENHVFAIS